MPVYNAERFLRQAVESVLNQSYKNLELIMIDDCSTDESFSIMREYENADDRVRVHSNTENSGVARTRNTGIQMATGKYIALIDSDDVWTLNKIEKQVNKIVENRADVVYCSFGFIDEKDNAIKKPFIVPEKTSYNDMLVKCVFTCSTIMIDAEILKAHPFKSDYYHEDFLLWTELMSLSLKAVGDKAVLMFNRQVDGSRSNNKLSAARHRWEIYRKALGMSILCSCITFVRYAVNGVIKYYI